MSDLSLIVFYIRRMLPYNISLLICNRISLVYVFRNISHAARVYFFLFSDEIFLSKPLINFKHIQSNIKRNVQNLGFSTESLNVLSKYQQETETFCKLCVRITTKMKDLMKGV